MSEKKVDDGGPIFAKSGEVCIGMSLRDWLAGRAMEVLVNHLEMYLNPEKVAEKSYEYADAMIKRRKESDEAYD